MKTPLPMVTLFDPITCQQMIASAMLINKSLLSISIVSPEMMLLSPEFNEALANSAYIEELLLSQTLMPPNPVTQEIMNTAMIEPNSMLFNQSDTASSSMMATKDDLSLTQHSSSSGSSQGTLNTGMLEPNPLLSQSSGSSKDDTSCNSNMAMKGSPTSSQLSLDNTSSQSIMNTGMMESDALLLDSASAYKVKHWDDGKLVLVSKKPMINQTHMKNALGYVKIFSTDIDLDLSLVQSNLSFSFSNIQYEKLMSASSSLMHYLLSIQPNLTTSMLGGHTPQEILDAMTSLESIIKSLLSK